MVIARQRHSMPSQTGKSYELPEADLRAVLGVADSLIAKAGRTTLALALRGSRAKRVLQHGVEQARGYGHFAGVSQDDVLARIDALIADDILRLEYRDGFPLLTYSDRGLQLAMRYAAEEWLGALRTQVQTVRAGAALELPPVLVDIQQRNQNTVLLLADLVGNEADSDWLPLLRVWAARETRRVRARLHLIITALEAMAAR